MIIIIKVKIEHITKKYPGVIALNDVSVSLSDDGITAICGANGAGKSTLEKIITGVIGRNDYEGDVYLNDERITFKDTNDAKRKGVYLVHQELSLIQEMTVEDNIFLGKYPGRFGVVNRRFMTEKVQEFASMLNVTVNPDEKVKNLSASMQQIIEIIKALFHNPVMIVFDEPTSSLSNNEIENLYSVIRGLKEKDVKIIYVSHKLNEIFELCNEVIVLKDGRFVNKAAVSEINEDMLVSWMTGATEGIHRQTSAYDGESLFKDNPMLELRDWNVHKKTGYLKNRRHIVKNVSFKLYPREIVGIYGAIGSGKTSLLRSIFYDEEFAASGGFLINGKTANIKSISDSISRGISFLTENRNQTGLCLFQSVEWNISLVALKRFSKSFSYVSNSKVTEAVGEVIDKLKIKVTDVASPVYMLSGGNMQKVVLGKWLLNQPDILLLDEPTKGIDITARNEIYNMLGELKNEGRAILFASSDPEEILRLSDRIIIMQDGKITLTMDKKAIKKEHFLKLCYREK